MLKIKENKRITYQFTNPYITFAENASSAH